MRKYLSSLIVYISWLIMAILIALLSPSCKVCPPASIVEKEVRHDSLIYIPHDSLIYIPGKEIVSPPEYIECDSLGIIKAFKRTYRSNGMSITTEVRKGVLTVHCKSDSLETVIRSWEKRYTSVMEHTQKQTVVKVETKNAPYVKPMMWVLLILFCIVLWQNRQYVIRLIKPL